jgi:peptidoglycan/LPS O-acetylase OafA/YrhL
MTASPRDIHHVRTYRPFIDGLRAIAIITVVASHSSLPGFSGGFIGVDIFFVISGYLIINQIIEDIQTKQFRILEFYTRRAFRILPAFLFVLVICLFLATTVFVQPEPRLFARSFFFSSIMSVNFYFLSSQGYFDMAAFTKPLLHMWSLAVEEQFYLVTPLILLVMTLLAIGLRPNNKVLMWVIATCGLGILAFVACVAFTRPDATMNPSFYMMPMRGWEFILGGAVPSFALAIRRSPTFVVHTLAIAGASLIILAVLSFDTDMSYPSYWATVPTIGATLIIVAGVLNPATIVTRALATWPMVSIGLVSYSWYLWHWPLISFVRTTNFGEQSVVAGLALGAISLALATITYRWIERPCRRWGKKCPLRPLYIVTTGIVLCAAVGEFGFQWSSRIAPLTLPALTGLEPQKIVSSDYNAISHRGVLLGDSHAVRLQEMLDEYGRKAGASFRLLAAVGCPPLLKIQLEDYNGKVIPRCPPFFDQIAFQGDEFAIFAARWNFYFGLPQSDPFDRSVIMVDEQNPKNPYQVFKTGLTATISEAERAGVQRIIIIGPLPEFPWYAPYCVMQEIRLGTDLCKVARKDVELRRMGTMSVLREVGGLFDSVRIIDPINLFCSASDCRPNVGRKLLFSDTNHLSLAGLELLYESYKSAFVWAFTGQDTGSKVGESDLRTR